MAVSNIFSIFKDFPELSIIISSKDNGPMKVRYELKNDSKTLKNREKFLNKYGLTTKIVVSGKLAQTDKVRIVGKNDAGTFIPGIDGLITSERNLYLSITIADCLPIFIYNTEKKVIALVHTGWEGLAKGIISNVINVFVEQYKSNPKKILVGIGPGIGVCHFEVKTDVLNKFKSNHEAIKKRDNKTFIDLKKIAESQLLVLGITKKHIEISPVCTYCEEEKYFSYRRGRTDPLEAMIVLMGLR